MEIDVQSLEVINNRDANQFEIHIGQDVGLIAYSLRGGNYVMIHTEVPPQYQGMGIADKLAHDALEMVKAEGAKIVPLCPFVTKYLQRHTEYEELVVSS